MELILNADDFGFSKGVNEGIIKSFKEGIVTSTTAMCTMPFIDHAVELSKQNTDLKVGLHLTLTRYKPALNTHQTIVDENNLFHTSDTLRNKEIDIEEVYAEYKAQVELFIKLFGRKPTHLDGHQHTHVLPNIVHATKRIMEEYDLDCRLLSDEVYFYEGFYNHFNLIHSINDAVKHAQSDGFSKIDMMCHPAIIDDFLLQNTSYNKQRANELSAIISPDVKDYIDLNNIKLGSY